MSLGEFILSKVTSSNIDVTREWFNVAPSRSADVSMARTMNSGSATLTPRNVRSGGSTVAAFSPKAS